MHDLNVSNVTKTFRMGVGRARVREMVPWPFDAALSRMFPRWWARDTFNALDGVSFSVPAGAAVGIVGHNGAGKTTLLKVISGVMAPTTGDIRVDGRVAALIDVLGGFHAELTGRENIYLLGAIHGFGRKEMAERIERILEFAEIDELADTPIKRYSAGMGARLGFGTLASLDPDVLLIDEVLAVGDSAFQRKCIGWLDEFRERGGTLLFVSHNLALVRHMTERSVWLDHGRVLADGTTREVLADYAKAMERRGGDLPVHRRVQLRQQMTARGLHRWGAGGARVEEVRVGEPAREGHELEITIKYATSEVDEAMFAIGFLDDSGRELGVASSARFPVEEDGSVRCVIRQFPFGSGIYFPVVGILSPDGQVRDRWRLDRAIVVEGNGTPHLDDFGPVRIPSTWAGGDDKAS